MIIGSYAVYLAISIAITIWVAHTLHRNGRVFLIDSFLGNAELADSVNHLLVVGFYLVNVGYIALAMRTSDRPADGVAAMELTTHKLGIVLLVLGVMHFINLRIFSSMRNRARRITRPPVEPVERVEHA